MSTLNSPSPSETHEDYRKLYIILGVSVGVHLLIFALSFIKIFRSPPPFLQEVSMDTELLTEAELGSAPKTVIPKAEVAKEVLVPDNQLPQLTKTFKVEEKLKEEEGLEPTKEVLKDEGKKIPDAVKDGVDEQKPDVTTKIKKSEALERLVRDQLKDKTKPNNRKLQAEDNTELAQIRDLMKTQGSQVNTGGIAGLDPNNRYMGYLTGAIRKNYTVPPTFKLANANGRAVLSITIAATGELMQAEITESSGDSIFDDSCVRSVNKSSPFKTPPETIAGTTISIECKP
ncbi:MAG: cell envelope integrity protein TolA [Proteobacteria bacterium]|nr:MAG: cell envelope integrity protein TolA [Pseudomonadota bacterium]